MVFLLRMQIFYRSENKNKANFPKEKSFGAATHHSGVVYKKTPGDTGSLQVVLLNV